MQQERKSDDGRRAAKAVLERVRALAEPLVAAHALELVDVEWSGRVLRVVIERPEGAGEVSIDDCTRMSRDLSTVLDVEDFIAASYSLEVSSPGLDRLLKSARDFRRQVGKPVKVKLVSPAPDGQRVLRGPLLEALDDAIVLEADRKRHQVELGNIAEARLVIEFGPARRENTGGKRRKGSSR